MHQIEIISGVTRTFGNRIVIMLMLFIVGVIATIFYTIQQPQVYRATAVIQTESPQISEAVAGSLGTSASHRLQLIEQRMMARDNLSAIIDRHGLFTAATDMSITEKVNLLRESIGTPQIAGEAGFGATSCLLMGSLVSSMRVTSCMVSMIWLAPSSKPVTLNFSINVSDQV